MKFGANRGRQLVLAGIAGTIAASVTAAQTYEAVPLGSLGGAFGAAATGVNDLGDVVGLSDTPSGEIRAFYWRDGVMIGLGTLGGPGSRALCINNNRQIVGTAQNASGNDRAVMWQRDAGGQWQITDLGTLSGGIYAVANRISDSGHIVGYSGRGGGPSHGFIYSSGVMTDLGILHYPQNLGYSEALGVNDAGHAVGYAYAPLWGPDHGFLYNGQTTIDITPAGQFSFARGQSINSSGVIAGITILPGGGSSGFEAAVYSQGIWTELGVLPGLTESEAYDLNNGGDVVGRSYDLATQVVRAFVYTGGAMVDLTDASGAQEVLVEALGISNTGLIVANADEPQGVLAYLLRPRIACYPNCDGSTVPPVLNVADFVCFLNKFAAGDPAANCDGSTVPPVLNVSDYICFQSRFAQGCT